MAKAYFIKHAVSRPLRDRNGRIFPFVPLGDDTGLLEVDTEKQRDWYDQLHKSNGTLGIMEASAAEVDEVKKNCSARRQVKSSRPAIRIDAPPRPRVRPPEVGSVVVQSDPVEIPSEAPKRRTRKPKLPTDSLAPVAESAATVPVLSPDQ